MRIIILNKKSLILSVSVILALIAVIILLVTMDNSQLAPATGSVYVDCYELDVTTANKKELPVYSVARTDKKIALTIDAAWEDDKTPFILEELSKRNIKVTFFLCGFWAKKYPDMVKSIYQAGHELGNHSSTHPHMNQLDSAQIQKELSDYDNMIERIVGVRTKCFRAPYGEYNDNVVKTVRGAGYEVVQWSIDTIDWKESRSAKTILDTVLPKLAPGCIILCHNNGYKIKEYLPTLLDTAMAQGYEFVTVSELLLSGETVIDVNGVQKKACEDG